MPLDLRDPPTDLPQATLPQTADYPTVTSRDPAAMRRTNASSDLSSTGARQSLTRRRPSAWGGGSAAQRGGRTAPEKPLRPVRLCSAGPLRRAASAVLPLPRHDPETWIRCSRARMAPATLIFLDRRCVAGTGVLPSEFVLTRTLRGLGRELTCQSESRPLKGGGERSYLDQHAHDPSAALNHDHATSDHHRGPRS